MRSPHFTALQDKYTTCTTLLLTLGSVRRLCTISRILEITDVKEKTETPPIKFNMVQQNAAIAIFLITIKSEDIHILEGIP